MVKPVTPFVISICDVNFSRWPSSNLVSLNPVNPFKRQRRTGLFQRLYKVLDIIEGRYVVEPGLQELLQALFCLELNRDLMEECGVTGVKLLSCTSQFRLSGRLRGRHVR